LRVACNPRATATTKLIWQPGSGGVPKGVRGGRSTGRRPRAGTVEAITINNQVWEAFVVETRAAA